MLTVSSSVFFVLCARLSLLSVSFLAHVKYFLSHCIIINKADFNSLRNSLQLNWDDLLLPHENNIEDKWLTFKNVLNSSVEQILPKNNNFSLWEKDSWDHPIDKNLHKKISRKIVFGRDT